MRNIFLVCCIFFSTQLVAAGFPDSFTVTERWISMTPSFDIEAENQRLGLVHRKFFSLVPEYHLTDVNGDISAKARMRFLSLLVTFDVTDANDQPLGTVENRLSWFYPTFDLVKPDKQVAAQAVLNFWGTRYTISDPVDGHVIAELSRPFFRLRNVWTVDILDQEAMAKQEICPEFFFTVMAFQVDYEYWKSRQYRGLPANDGEFELRKSFSQELFELEASLDLEEPAAKDFEEIELITNALSEEGENSLEKGASVLSRLMELLQSDELSPSQKAALFQMLDKRLS